MKSIKRLASILLVLIMVFAMATTVMADTTDPTEATETKYTISASNDHTYEVYQIFTGDLSEGTLSNVVWGENGTVTEGDPVSADILEELADIKDDPLEIAQLDMIRKYVDLDSEAHATVTKDAPASVVAGYYLIKDAREPVTNNDSYTLYIVQVSDNVTIKETYTISASNDHTYEVYQIFTGDLSEGTLSNVVWGENGTVTEGDPVSATILKALVGTNGSGDTAQLDAILPYVNLGSTAHATVTKDAPASVFAGYYLIKDANGTVTGDDSYTLYIVEVVDEVTISPKGDIPEVEKKVDDVNDSNTSEDEKKWEDSADYDIGDDVPFKITATLPSNFEDYETYTVTFIDTMCKGLTYNKDAVVTFGDTDITPDAENIKTETTADGETVLTITLDDLTSIEDLTNSSEIVLKYTAELNDEATIGAVGNINKVKMRFSNDPNWIVVWEDTDGDDVPDTPKDPSDDDTDNDGDGETDEEDEKDDPKGETPEDTVIVFTYKTVINKVDGDENALTGADFKLEKKNANGTWTEIIKSAASTANRFEFVGLDDGVYKLTETVTPDGYNTIDPIEFTITATHTEENANPALETLTGEAVVDGTISFDVDTGVGSLTTEVVNNRGSILPETGGIGTTIFYIVGGILVVAAVVLLVTKKRMSAQ